MISAELYHSAIVQLLDISDSNDTDKQALQPALQHLKNQRLKALRDEATMKNQTFS